MLTAILKPEYLFRPQQFVRRITRRQSTGFEIVKLPWGKTIQISLDDKVGRQIAALGLHDLVTTETIWRLCDEGEIAIDIGANIGYISFVFAERVRNGTVMCFEPHPTLYEELESNVASLRKQKTSAQIKTFQEALGPESGELPLHIPPDFSHHRGESTLASDTNGHCGHVVNVKVGTLDQLLSNGETIGVIKIDVEGFELEVLKGASRLFQEKRVRDCVFEEHLAYPTPVCNWFEEMGYQVFRLHRSLFRPRLLQPDSSIPRTKWNATSFLATTDPQRAIARFHASGWHCLLHRSSSRTP
jgi:FkbM family methyltransferase